jgi:tRNA(Met) cytidine acetyltransferase
MLMLDAELDPALNNTSQPSTLEIHSLQADQLTRDQLKPIFALLVQAHYQTSPTDLQQLLSSPDLSLFVGYRQGLCVAVLWITQEGGLSGLSRQRRVKGHLVPQLLRQISCQDSLLALNAERVMRLAVHPALQRQGIASQLISYWLAHSQADYVSASFGVSLELYYFWRKQGFYSVHLGAKRDKASGTHNLVMVKPLNNAQQFTPLIIAYAAQLPHSLMEFVTHLSAPLTLALLAEHNAQATASPSSREVSGYVAGNQSYETLSHALWHWTVTHADLLLGVDEQQQAVWLDKVLRKQAWSTVAQTHQLAGRKAIENLLKTTLEQAIKQKPEQPEKSG